MFFILFLVHASFFPQQLRFYFDLFSFNFQKVCFHFINFKFTRYKFQHKFADIFSTKKILGQRQNLGPI